MVVADKRFFQGIPCPAAATFVAAFVWMVFSYENQGHDWQLTTLFITVIASLAMVSNIPYYSFKDINLKGRMPFIGLIILVIIFLLISWDPPNVLFSLCLLYFISGPIGTLPYFRNKFSHVKSVPNVLNRDEDNDPEV
jgi:CDP-diacylglycerol--serine O-phosphatidyltransferase